MNKGDRIQTPCGEGEVVDIEFYNRLHGGMKRYGVNLDKNPFLSSPAYFFEDEVSKVLPRKNENTH